MMTEKLAELVEQLHEEVVEAKDELIENQKKQLKKKEKKLEDKEERLSELQEKLERKQMVEQGGTELSEEEEEEIEETLTELEDLSHLGFDGSIPCPHCGKEYSGAGMIGHIKSHNVVLEDRYSENGRLVCPIEEDEFKEFKKFSDHFKNIHGLRPVEYYVRELEDEDLETQVEQKEQDSSEETEEESAEQDSGLQCPRCSENLGSIYMVSSHLKNHDLTVRDFISKEAGEVECPECDSTFDDYSGLSVHLSTEHNSSVSELVGTGRLELESDSGEEEQVISNPEDRIKELSLQQVRNEIRSYLENHRGEGKTKKSIARNQFNIEFDDSGFSGSKPYQRITDALDSMSNIESTQVGREKQYSLPVEEPSEDEGMKAKDREIERLGKEEYQIRRHVINRIMKESESNEFAIRLHTENRASNVFALSSFYSGGEELTSRDFFEDLCTKEYLRKALRYDFDAQMEFTVEKKTKSKDPIAQYEIQVEHDIDMRS